MNKFLFKQIDNINLVLFRVVFGLLITLEAFGSIATGWVRKLMVDTPFTFNFIGFDFLQVLQGPQAYAVYALMGIFGICIMLGFKYRFTMFGYAILWSCVYFMQKSSYNNHYYLMMLLCWIMAFLPAHRYLSLDARINPKIKSLSMPRWVLLVLILQVWIVYTYASVNKFYPGWLDGSAISTFMAGRINYPVVGELLQLDWVHKIMIYFGIYFDLLIVPMLLWRRTRLLGFGLSLFFHLFNSVIFQIGVFPYMSIAFSLFFFSPETLQKRLFPSKELYTGDEVRVPNYKPLLVTAFSIYFIFQIGLPLRHWFIEDDVLWTNEGHKLSWRMMLRARRGTLTVYVKDKATGERIKYKYTEMTGPVQSHAVKSDADLMWQLAQRIKKKEAEEGRDVAVYMDSWVSINNGPYFKFTNDTIDIASEKWDYFKHTHWILPSPEDYNKKSDKTP